MGIEGMGGGGGAPSGAERAWGEHWDSCNFFASGCVLVECIALPSFVLILSLRCGFFKPVLMQQYCNMASTQCSADYSVNTEVYS